MQLTELIIVKMFRLYSRNINKKINLKGVLDKREGSILLFKRINLFQKESIFLQKSAKHLDSL